MPRDENYDTGAPPVEPHLQFGVETFNIELDIDNRIRGSGEFDTYENYDPVKTSQTATTGGRKFDGDKLEYGLTPPLALKAMVDVLTFGAQKYERDNWKKVPDSKRRYFDALQRHLWAWKEGEILDPESGKHHLAHAMCCLSFLYEHDVKYSVDDVDKTNNGTV